MEEVPPKNQAGAESSGKAAQVSQAKPTLDPTPQKVVKKLPMGNNAKMKYVAIGVIVVLAGVGTGWMLSGVNASTGSGPAPTSNISSGTNSAGGAVDETVFSDTATGVLYDGGIEGEGTHHLDTGAGEEKFVYLLSTVLDLQSFVGKKVEVQGKTLGAEKAGWLMDVGKIKEVK